MNVCLYYNDQEASIKVANELKTKMESVGITIDKKNPDVIISIGGDGTLLNAFHEYKNMLDNVSFMAVHTGHLGFYTDWRDFEIDEIVDSVQNLSEGSISYPLLEVTIEYTDDREPTRHLALNESSIKQIGKTMVANVFIKDELFECFRGDGLSISTPSGSTAYNKSIGGAVIHPRVNVLQLTEIASLNNRVFRTLGSPAIIANDEFIRIEIVDQDDYIITLDHITLIEPFLKSIKYEIAKERIHFAAHRHTHFWRRVKDAFIGDL